MEFLDLTLHDRDDYEGKVVECNGGRYVVGEPLGVGAERIVHTLINQQSTLSLFVIKILKRPRPRGIYTRQIAALRANPELARIIPFTLEVDVPGGMVEFQRNVDASEREDKAATQVRQGFAALQGADPSPHEAQKQFADALRINPAHTEALYGMAHALWRGGAPFEALPMIENAVQIEPNALQYRRTHIELALATEQLGYALWLYREAARIFENVHDLDELATDILLNAGNPEGAQQCVVHAMVSTERRAELGKIIEDAISARARAVALMHSARSSVMAKNWSEASATLLRAQREYNRDPDVCMNTALAALRDGDPRLCAGLMLHCSTIVPDWLAAACLANAGFAMLRANELESAVGILDMAAVRLHSLHGDQIPQNEIDLPSVGIWIDGGSWMEERISVASDLLTQGLEQAAANRVLVPERVHLLAAAYRAAAAAC